MASVPYCIKFTFNWPLLLGARGSCGETVGDGCVLGLDALLPCLSGRKVAWKSPVGDPEGHRNASLSQWVQVIALLDLHYYFIN